MRTWLFPLLLLLAPQLSAKEYPAPAPSAAAMTVTIYSTTDGNVFEPVIRDFQQLHPDYTVVYEDIDATPLYDRYLRESAAGTPRADVLLSASMDLQAKLVNDGYAMPHSTANAKMLPAWARWRDEAFGITFEPAVMVFNTEAMRGESLPGSRAELLGLLKREPEKWRGRVGTYDIAHSGVGYLLASQDARQSSEFGALVETFGDVGTVVDENTSTLLDRLEAGELAIGYNLLGSYARARIKAGAPLAIVYPNDYTLAVSRTAVLPKDAPHPQAAHAFLEYLLSLRGQQILVTRCGLPAVREEIVGPYTGQAIGGEKLGILRPVVLGPGLLVYLDQQKKRRFLGSWNSVLNRPAPGK